MASGPEALLKSLFRAMGFDPAEMATGLQQFITDVYTRLDDFDKRMTAQEILMRQIVEKLDGQHREQRGEIIDGNVVQFAAGIISISSSDENGTDGRSGGNGTRETGT